jgi:hypothetical protein
MDLGIEDEGFNLMKIAIQEIKAAMLVVLYTTIISALSTNARGVTVLSTLFESGEM